MILLTKEENKLGIENLKKLSGILIRIYAKVKALIKDFDLLRALDFVAFISKYKDDLDIFEDAWKEIGDLDQNELTILLAHLQDEASSSGIENSKILLAIQDALALIKELFDLWDNALRAYEKALILWEKIKDLREKNAE